VVLATRDRVEGLDGGEEITAISENPPTARGALTRG
jgi:hypothetical protein